MMLIDLVRLKSNEIVNPLRDEKVSKCKEKMGSKYLLHPNNFVKRKLEVNAAIPSSQNRGKF